MNGVLLMLQFFTILPIHKELPLGRKEVTTMYNVLPFAGAVIGIIMYSMSALLVDFLHVGPLFIAVFVVFISVVLTGGLHLDGWADTGDAFFSYQEREKRLEILEDPRLGAFGTMALIFLLLIKVALFHEVFSRGSASLALFIIIPFMTRVGMNICFSTMQPAKNKGIAHFFKEKMDAVKVLMSSIISGGIVLIGFVLMTQFVMVAIVLLTVTVGGILLFRIWAKKHFGGVSGDLAGAFIEGMEAVLWISVLGLL